MLWDSHFLKVASVFSILKKIQTFTFFRRILWTPSPPLQGLWLSPRPHFEHTVMKWNRGCRWFTPPVRASAACLKWFYCRSNCLNTINDEENLRLCQVISDERQLSASFLLQINPNCSFITGLKTQVPQVQPLLSCLCYFLRHSVEFSFI